MGHIVSRIARKRHMYCTCTSTAAAETHARDVLMSSSSDEEQMPRMAVLQSALERAIPARRPGRLMYVVM